MYLKRSIDSITYIPEISELTDNSDRLYNIGGNLYFNGTAVGSGSGDASNDWVNSNDYATYATLINSINVSSASITGNIYNTWETVNTAIDTVQGNVNTGVSNTFNTYTTLNTSINTVQDNVATGVANTFNTYTALNTNINTVQDNVAIGVANTYNTYATLNTSIDVAQNTITANVYNTWASLDLRIDAIDAGSETSVSDLIGGIVGANTNIDTVQSNLTSSIASINTVQNNVTTVVANTFNTYATLNTSIDIVQGNVTSNVTTLTANDGTTLLTARSNDWNTLLTTQSNDWNTLLTAQSNDLSTYTTLNGLINTVQSNLSSVGSGGGVWTEDAGRAYYVGKVVVNSDVVQGEQFYVNGNAKVTSDFEVGGTLTESSSVRLKENIAPLDDQLNKLMLLRPVEYDKILSKSHEYGLIAEEVANVIPEVVSEGSSSIQYTRLIPTLIKAIQELTEKVNKLESK